MDLTTEEQKEANALFVRTLNERIMFIFMRVVGPKVHELMKNNYKDMCKGCQYYGDPYCNGGKQVL